MERDVLKRTGPILQYTQFGIDVEVKDQLDKFKGERKEEILQWCGRSRRHVSNTDVVAYLLYLARKNEGK